jgi:hypothetical protein
MTAQGTNAVHGTDALHAHDWQPVQGWVGRYRCAGCGVLGYRGVTQPDVHYVAGEKPEVIFPYLCASKVGGQPCGRGAVTRKPRQACAEHRR